jgi:plastocyanin
MRGTLIALALAAAVFAGCGGDDEEEPASTPAPTEEATQEAGGGGEGGGGTLAFSAPADGSLKFDQGDVTAKAGKVTVTFDNPSSVPHAVEIKRRARRSPAARRRRSPSTSSPARTSSSARSPATRPPA